ncbi:hypothetical protein SynMITS9220_00956 [Synechococcus sp. MIT S9220]|uniref:hypothetical protein n=1 Tax=unclassified Synechococcus TaxID=2626047 RepID=UPI0007BB491F|nr:MULTISPECIES: hypothetical protein [unclassified Synechococcus]KZR88148.1 hypothetical protein MITS9508_02291 [Synechococcus sp. MIT S9508]NOL47409.1 hypothetical protein [Synechococcus sp. MIT S9220]QNJ22262.1 hypothetical protein SynMITS9220_00956 [Synechococcus sp. MIT S9220]CAI8373925.1 MAG: Uncharacterised protein [Synechococcus sp. MIT S9220]
MARSLLRYSSSPESRRCLERCWPLECDLDPLILRARLLHGQGRRPQALAVEEELQPMF